MCIRDRTRIAPHFEQNSIIPTLFRIKHHGTINKHVTTWMEQQKRDFGKFLNNIATAKLFGRQWTYREGTQLNRLEAMAILKDLVANNLVDPSFVNICERKPNLYQIQIKSYYNRKEIE